MTREPGQLLLDDPTARQVTHGEVVEWARRAHDQVEQLCGRRHGETTPAGLHSRLSPLATLIYERLSAAKKTQIEGRQR